MFPTLYLIILFALFFSISLLITIISNVYKLKCFYSFMISEFIYALLSVVIVSLIAFIGVLTLWIKHDTLKKCILYFVSFSAGALIGDVFIHLLPEAAEDGFGLRIGLYVISGILFSFIVEKVIRWHHCHNIDYHKHHGNVKPVAYMNLIGDGVHNFIDGIIIAASYL